MKPVLPRMRLRHAACCIGILISTKGSDLNLSYSCLASTPLLPHFYSTSNCLFCPSLSRFQPAADRNSHSLCCSNLWSEKSTLAQKVSYQYERSNHHLLSTRILLHCRTVRRCCSHPGGLIMTAQAGNRFETRSIRQAGLTQYKPPIHLGPCSNFSRKLVFTRIYLYS